jgi:archaellum component FlaC
MAENSNINIKLDLDADGAVRNIDKSGSAIKGLGNSTECLKAQLKDLQKEFDKVAATAPGGGRYQELVEQISVVKSKISQATNAVNNEGIPAFEGFANSTANVSEKFKSFDIKGVGDQLKASAENVKNFKFSSLTNGLKSLLSNILYLSLEWLVPLVMSFLLESCDEEEGQDASEVEGF